MDDEYDVPFHGFWEKIIKVTFFLLDSRSSSKKLRVGGVKMAV